ncbi:MAG: hypothetical protein IJ535_02725 [Pseudobutyrivibrio sp.]|uniref:hypothetical protein n=1 Tax=Pseudobutyrivibrio sp. TaxID=2014367 RepID=UPI0025F6763D|nr:hypothetical protein [Pseudobutyrivibrio sp.]MBQ8488674.1 hypothetical protein [Pseudobutyrivibrio sp.]
MGRKNTIIIIIAFAILACLIGILIYSKTKIKFYDDSYKREYTYSGVFKTFATEYNGGNYIFESTILDKKEATSLVKAFDESRKQIIKSSNKVTQEKINVYVVHDNRLVGPVIENDALFLPQKYLDEYDYRYWLVQLMLSKGHCRATFDEYKTIFNLKDIDYPRQFSTEGLSKEQLKILDETELFVDGNNNYIFKGDGTKFIINRSKLDDDTCGKMMDLIQAEATTKKNLKKLLEEVSIEKSMYGGDVDDITYHIENKGGRSYASTNDAGKIEITLNDLTVRTLEHELMHGFFAEYSDPNKYWIEEGFCEYVGYILYPEEQMVEYIKQFAVDDSYDQGDFKHYLQSKKYDDNGIVKLYYDYVVNRLYQRKDVSDYPKLKEKLSINFGANEQSNYYGIDLSYTEAMSFTAYLLDLKDLEGLFDFIYSDKSYEEFFGKSYVELENSWKQSVSE